MSWGCNVTKGLTLVSPRQHTGSRFSTYSTPGAGRATHQHGEVSHPSPLTPTSLREEANAAPLQTTTFFNSPPEKRCLARLKNYRV